MRTLIKPLIKRIITAKWPPSRGQRLVPAASARHRSLLLTNTNIHQCQVFSQRHTEQLLAAHRDDSHVLGGSNSSLPVSQSCITELKKNPKIVCFPETLIQQRCFPLCVCVCVCVCVWLSRLGAGLRGMLP